MKEENNFKIFLPKKLKLGPYDGEKVASSTKTAGKTG
jgi:hypothetical protein